MYKFGTIESALKDSLNMISLADKKLFVHIYGNLISADFKEKIHNGNVESMFEELCEKLKEKQANQ